jgi:GPH family glycoside/pentoside/hexuronide:cation symporter
VIKVPARQKIAWGVGGLADSLMSNSIMQLALPIYNIALGVSPALISIALGVPRFLDAIVDPIMGNITDNTRSRWGRRRPYIALGAILTSLLFVILWMPPTSWSQHWLFGYFLVVSTLYFFSYTIFFIPQNALGFELSNDYNERTSVMAYRSFISSFAGFIMPWIYKLCFRPEFGHNEVEGVRVVAILFGIVMLVCGLVPAIFCTEKVQGQAQPKIPIKQAFLYTVQNRAFLLLAGVVFTILIGLFIVAPFATYINIYYILHGNKEAAATIGGVGGTVYAVLGLASVPLVSWLARVWGKRRTLITAQILVLFASLMCWFLFTPKYPYLQLVYMVLACPGLTCVWILTGSMLADVCDVDELKSGLRREGMYGAVFALVFKAGIGAVMVLSGFIVQLSGFDALNPTSIVSMTGVFRMRVMFAVVPAVCLAISAYLTFLFPITEASARKVRATLDERKAQADADEAAVEADKAQAIMGAQLAPEGAV